MTTEATVAAAAVAALSVEEKVGQVMFLAFSGNDIAGPRSLIERHGLGGVYLSQDNATTPEEAAALSAELQRLARSNRPGIPLLLGADHEGTWNVLAPYMAAGPGNMGLGAAREPGWTAAMYAVLAAELRAVGYNTLLGPCVDVNSNPKNAIIGMRSFGDDPAQVAALATAAVRGARGQGIITAAKHFPGHGDTHLDTHRGLAVVDRPESSVRATELVPHRAAVAAGVDMVMTSHIIFPAFDAERPATMSASLLQGLLRQELGFQGVIVSDSMNMQAIGRGDALGDAVVSALAAGVDLMMFAEEHYAHEPNGYLQQQEQVVTRVVDAVRKGELPAARLDDAVGRVVALKRRAGLSDWTAPSPEAARRAVGDAVHRQIAASAAQAGVTLLGDRPYALPLPTDTPLVLVNTTSTGSYGILTRTRGIGPNQTRSAFATFCDAVRLRAPQAIARSAEEAFEADALRSDAIPSSGPVIAVAENYPLPGEDFVSAAQVPRLRKLRDALPGRLIVVALRDPYFLSTVGPFDTLLCTCSFRPEAAAAAAAVLFGEASAVGRLPVRLEARPRSGMLRL